MTTKTPEKFSIGTLGTLACILFGCLTVYGGLNVNIKEIDQKKVDKVEFNKIESRQYKIFESLIRLETKFGTLPAGKK